MAEKTVAERIRPDMRSPDEELQVRSKALRIARMKAKVHARLEKEADRRVKMEEYKLLRLYPAKHFIASYPLKERTDGMLVRNQWYKFQIPTERDDPEVALQLWRKITGEDLTYVGEAGDLYSLELSLPMNVTLPLHIIVESAEAREHPGLALQYSVFDIGQQEKAFTVGSEAWFNYLLYRDEDNKEDLDMRILYHAICNRWEMGTMTLGDFAKSDPCLFQNLIDGMIPGNDYPRPSAEESLLETVPPKPGPSPEMAAELLRTQEKEDEELEIKVSDNLDKAVKKKFGRRPSFKDILEYESMVARNLGMWSPKKRTFKKKRVNPYPKKEVFRFHPDVEKKINKSLNKYLEDYLQEPNVDPLPDDRDHKISIREMDDPEEVVEFLDRQGALSSPVTLKSWSGSGWETNDEDQDDEPDDDEEETVLPLDENGRIIPDLGPVLETKVDVTHPQEEGPIDEKLDNSIASLASSLSGIEVLDRSSELESHPRDFTTSSDEARNREIDDSLPDFDDSVEVFLAKQRQEHEIVTVSSSDSDNVTPKEDPEGDDKKKLTGFTRPSPTGNVTFQGTRFHFVYPEVASFYPGAYVDDLAACSIPRELWPFGQDDGNTKDTQAEDCCSNDRKDEDDEKKD